MYFVSLLLVHVCLSLGDVEDVQHAARRQPDTRLEDCQTLTMTNLASCEALREEAHAMRSEAYSAVDKADLIREQAYRVKDEAYGIRDEVFQARVRELDARRALETTLVETIAVMKSQATACNLYMQEIRATLTSLDRDMGDLKDELGDVKDEFGDVKDEVGVLKDKVSDLKDGVGDMKDELGDVKDEVGDLKDDVGVLTIKVNDMKDELESMKEESTETQSGELIPAVRVQQISTHGDYTADKAVDGNVHTLSHTAQGRNLWFRYYFASAEKVGAVKIINGAIDAKYYARLNGVRIVVMVNHVQRVPCHPDSITIRQGTGIGAQTYLVECGGVNGLGVELNLDTTTALGAYLELREVEVYAG